MTIEKLLQPWKMVTQDGGAQDNQEGQTGGGGSVFIIIIWLVIGLGAGFLSWTTNAHEYMGMRIIYTICAFFYGIFYLIYYVIIRMLLGYELNVYSKITV